MDYFCQRKIGFAIGIKSTEIYDTPLELKDINPNIKYPPQSFRYI